MTPIDLDPLSYPDLETSTKQGLVCYLVVIFTYLCLMASEVLFRHSCVPFDVSSLYVITIGITVYLLGQRGLYLNIGVLVIVTVTRIITASHTYTNLIVDFLILNVLNVVVYRAIFRLNDLIHQAKSDIAEIQIKEAVINENQKNYLRLFNSVENALWLVEKDWTIFYVNETVRVLLGKSNKELVGRHISEFYVCDSAEQLENEFSEVLAGKLSNSTMSIQTKNHVQRFFESSVSPASWHDRPMYFIISRDITDRLKAEHQLNVSEDKFRKAFYNNPAIMAISSLANGVYLDVNDSFTRTLGYSREDVIGHSATELNIIQDFADRENYISMVNNFGNLNRIEIPVRCKDGTVIYGSIYADTIEFAEQTSLLTVMLDITEQKRLNTTLINQSRMLYGLSYSSSQLLTSDGLNQSILTALAIIGRALNSDLVQIFSYDAESSTFSLQNSWSSKADDEDRLKQINMLCLHPDLYDELCHDRPITHLLDPESSVIDTTKSQMAIPIKIASKLWGMVLIKYFETERTWSKGDEVILLAFANSIAGAIERNITLEELKRSKAEAEHANKAKSSFLAMMSHEIRTPMNGVIGMANLLKQMEMNSEMQDYVETIRISGDALLDLINDILDFSKIESGFLELDNHTFDLNACIEDVLELLSVRAAEKDLELVFCHPQNINCMIYGDSSRIRQILLNLIGNAIKFTETGQIKIEINVLEQSNQLTHIEVLISDTGIGISPEHLEKIFKPFAQAESTTSRRYGGTGLGLSISQRLAEMMGGKIAVESSLGHGSKFRFTFETYFIYDHKLEFTDMSVLEGKKVFLQLQNSDSLQIVRDHLTANGIEVYVINNLGNVLSLIEQNVCFTAGIVECSDVPHFSSIQVKALREVDGYQTLPMIFVRAIGKKVLDLEQQDIRYNHFLTKPIRINQLSQMLVSIVRDGSLEQKSEHNGNLNRALAEVHPHTILVAEDNIVNQKLIRNVLSKLGYNADVAANGDEVLSALKMRNYDLILMDIVMPVLNGIEATKLIRKMDLTVQPTIVAMTANVMEDDKKSCFEAGMSDYLLKPIDFKELVKVLEEVT